MASFYKICEELSLKPDNWGHKKDDDPELDEQAMNVILRGLEVRPDRTDGNTFWDDFVTVISNNSEGAAKLLGIGSDVISKWSNKIKTAVKRVREENAADNDKTQMTQTGEDGLSNDHK